MSLRTCRAARWATLAAVISACSFDSPTETVSQRVAPDPDVSAAIVPRPSWHVQLLPLLSGGTWSEATAINDQGVVVGFGNVAGGATHAFKFAGGVLVDLGTDENVRNSYAFGLNEQGHVVGAVTRLRSASLSAVRWAPSGTMAALPPLYRSGSAKALDINDAGVVVGSALTLTGRWRPARWSPSGVSQLPVHSVEWNWDSEARAINNAGEIVGFGYLGYWWDASGAVKDVLDRLDLINDPPQWGSDETRYYDITNGGEAAGWLVLEAQSGSSFAGWEGVLRSSWGSWDGSPAEPDFSLSEKGRLVTTIWLGVKRAITNTFAGDANVTLPLPVGYRSSAGADVNTCGTAVGWAASPSGVRRAAVWRPPWCD